MCALGLGNCEARALSALRPCLHSRDRRDSVCPREQKGREDESEVHDDLPEEGLLGLSWRSNLDEALEEMNGRNANERCGELYLEDTGIDV